MTKFTGTWPKNLNLQGQLSFPITSAADLPALKEWREKKELKKPKYADKIGGGLLLRPAGFAKVQTYLVETYLPFVNELYKETDGEKGIEPNLVKTLLAQAKKGVWLDAEGKPNLPIRELNEKDKENTGGDDSPFVGKVRFAGPFESDIPKAAIIRLGEGGEKIVTIDDLLDDDILPENHRDSTKLWWGSGWTFRIPMRFNAYDSASVGVTAYAQKMFLLPHLGMPVSSGDDSDVLGEDGDDWDE